ncbi:uncharacterized protein LOC113360463 [Papaver somniferum]|uniref:uncharacterized protein LOC113360463 n=1 Tax=Papaver somniferum TaxID=3469 RepID=UPI000E701D0F|nr:uncharacterized protein LOC113360463 [Papaver somniferum]
MCVWRDPTYKTLFKKLYVLIASWMLGTQLRFAHGFFGVVVIQDGETSDSSKNPNENKTVSFADLVKGKKPYLLNDSDLLSLPDASLYEKELALDLPLKLTQERREIFQFSLIRRLNFKGLKLNEVQKVLEEQWKLSDRRSNLVPMTKFFFIIKLTIAEDKKHVWHGDTWVVQDQQLRVFNFYPNFDPERQNTSCDTVWVSFPCLYIELWTKRILLSIAKILGRPIAIEKKTLDHDVGNYAAVLIDIDFAKPIPKRIRLKAKGNEFWQYVEV